MSKAKTDLQKNADVGTIFFRNCVLCLVHALLEMQIKIYISKEPFIYGKDTQNHPDPL